MQVLVKVCGLPPGDREVFLLPQSLVAAELLWVVVWQGEIRSYPHTVYRPHVSRRSVCRPLRLTPLMRTWCQFRKTAEKAALGFRHQQNLLPPGRDAQCHSS